MQDDRIEIRCVNMTHEDWVRFACVQLQDISSEALGEVLRIIERDLGILLAEGSVES